ncbi:efflux RND transporter periplasmic adaptor subunit [Dinghuibacter silviterrae]|uniref:HlyD family secretion protein n=1 Tax=Dinghuibacter silviterrae TaxID=1539049 RepID=A0A4R8DQF6_9BACT|nr:efflux RND transporter periplasmic adaptor subunit [Dinghuibacter silviterrae]TDX00016.1 HlyD family secretion protein [Dinghuibacter silviterrae]
MKKKKNYIGWWIAGLVVLAGAAVWFFGFVKKDKPAQVLTATAFMGTITQSVTATGSLQPVDTVAVGTQESGTIAKVYVDFNSVVKKGQLLAELDKSLLNASVAQFEGSLAAAQSQVVFEKANFERQQLLYNTGAISKADYETAEYQYQAAEGSVNSIASQLRGARQNLAYASIYSPIDGTVLSRAISAGQTVAASFSTPTLFIIARDLTKMQVQAAVDEADIGNVTNGQNVTFTVDAFPNNVFEGIVQDVRLNPTTSSNVVTYTTIIAAPNQDKKLKPGMTANISIFTQVDSGVMLIPAKALKFSPDPSLAKNYKVVENPEAAHIRTTARLDTIGLAGEVVKKNSNKGRRAAIWIRSGDSLVQKVIRTGLNDDTNVEVVSGLSGDETIVVGTQAAGTAPAATTTATSPFMPRRGGSSTTKKPAAN